MCITIFHTNFQSMFASSIGSPANQVTLQEIIKRYSLTDEQLDSEIDEITFLAEYFDGVKIYSNAMGLTRAEQADVNELFHKRGTQVAMTECLTVWKQHNPYAVTYRALLELLLRLRKERIADEICQHLTQCECILSYSYNAIYSHACTSLLLLDIIM